MKNLIRIISSPFVVLALAMCSQGQNDLPKAADVSPQVFHQMIDSLEDEQLLDVRTAREWASGTLPNAITINWHDPQFKKEVQKLDKDRVVLVYCAVGGRSRRAMDELKKMGFKEIYNLTGGINAWKRMNYEVDR